jgi:hypothetical protein
VDRPAGPVVFRNATTRPVRIQVVSCVNRFGLEQPMSATWDVKPGFYGYLPVNCNKLVARELKCNLVDGDGTTQIRWVARQLDDDGDFVLLFQEDNRREHRRLLGKVPDWARPRPE